MQQSHNVRMPKGMVITISIGLLACLIIAVIFSIRAINSFQKARKEVDRINQPLANAIKQLSREYPTRIVSAKLDIPFCTNQPCEIVLLYISINEAEMANDHSVMAIKLKQDFDRIYKDKINLKEVRIHVVKPVDNQIYKYEIIYTQRFYYPSATSAQLGSAADLSR